MRLSRAVAFSILTSLGVQGLVLPSIGGVIDVFGGVDKFTDKINQKLKPLKEAAHEAAQHLGMQLSESLAPIVNVDSVRDIIPHRYIIVLNDDVKPEEAAFHQEWVALTHANSLNNVEKDHSFFAATQDFKTEGGIIDSFRIDSLLNGYYGYFLDETIELIRKNPMVKFVERDSLVHANEFQADKGAPWGLARVSHRQPLSLSSFDQYLYDNDAGKGVTAYVIDTGVHVDHVEFGGRATWGSTIPSGDSDTDGNGHGTHCAGTIGSSAYGVAKKADIVAVKVLRSNGSGSMSDVVKGVEYAALSHQDAVKTRKKGFKGSTANMSLGGGKSPALDLAVNAAVKAGLHFAVAAGNENQDACNTSPASAENAITVGASTISDARAYFSNYGKCVDIFAPGLNILSTYIGSDSATAYLSGTSMASPHICGLLTYYLSLQPDSDSEYFVAADGVSPNQLKKNLISYASTGLLSDIPEDTPNILAFNGAGQNLTDFWHGK
ncbi:Cerevisin [Spathaspora sp. JA1]|nr:Cerevisin [Spathaspora sp. JA1]